jgi:hypothetical protein
MMKIIVILLLFLKLLLVGCNNSVNESDLDNKWIVPLDMWEQKESVFEKVEEELIHFVAYFKENELFDELDGTTIFFNNDEESAIREAGRATMPINVSVYNGEIINSHVLAIFGSMRLFRDDPELIDIVRAIDERGIIAYIAVRGGASNTRIRFQVKPEHPYIANIRGMENNFHYVEGDAHAMSHMEQIRENWYMQIHPPHD